MLPEPGSPSFIKNLLQHIVSSAPLDNWTPDPTLFSALLLSLIVNQGGLIVNTPDNAPSLRHAVHAVIHLSRAVFGRHTHHLSLNGDSTPGDVSFFFAKHLGQEEDEEDHTHDHNGNANGNGVNRHQNSYGTNGSTLVLDGLEYTDSPARIKLCEILVQRKVCVRAAYMRPEQRAQISGADEILALANPLFIIWVKRDGGEGMPSWILDQFASSIAVDGDAFESKSNDPLMDTTLDPPVPLPVSRVSHLSAYIHQAHNSISKPFARYYHIHISTRPSKSTSQTSSQPSSPTPAFSRL